MFPSGPIRPRALLKSCGGQEPPGSKLGTYLVSDEFGVRVARDAVHVHDLQATILLLLGLDHTRLTFHLQGRDYRLMDVFGNVVKDIPA